MDNEEAEMLYREFGYTPPRYTVDVTAEQLLERMQARGITGRKLAEEAGMAPQNVSAILCGRQPLGRKCRERIERAIASLGLEREEPAHERAVVGLTFRISIL